MTPDRELLQHYAATNSEDAFAEVVRRHVNLVYSAALRQVNGDAHLAHDVAQTVFTDLARKAGALARHESLTGWLYTSAHFAAAKIIRGENRRRDREEKFMREPTNNSGMGSLPVHSAPAPDWEKLRPTIDDAMHELKTADREAVLLRYFENRPFAEVGTKLGLNENAARMRVERAVEKLRGILTKRGLATTSALAMTISANAVQIAPAGLATTLTTISLTTAATGTLTLTKIITTMKLKLIFSALIVAGAATALVVQHQTQTKLNGENESLRQQISQLQTDNAGLSNRVATMSNSTALPNDQFDELLKLRGAVGVLRRQAGEFEKLRIENSKISRELKDANQLLKTAPNSERVVFDKKRIETINDAKEIGLAMLLWAGDNGNQYPDNFEIMTNELGGVTNLLRYKETFELLNAGVPNAHDTYPKMITVREREPRQTPDGHWQRIYTLADGSVQTAIPSDGNFDAWEKANTTSPPPNQ